jgi:intein/homing endonuclease
MGIDLLKSKRATGGEVKDEIDDVYMAVKGMARELNTPVWSVSQVNRCHSINDLVDTPTGKLPIGQIKEGDEVLTHLGYKKVTRVYPIQKQPAYKIKLKNGKEITVSANHLMPTQYGQIKSISTGLKIGDKLFTKK